MNDKDFYNYIMSLPLIEQVYELKKILDSYNKGEPPSFMNSDYYSCFMDCLSMRLPNSFWEIMEMIEKGATNEEIEALFVINKLIGRIK